MGGACSSTESESPRWVGHVALCVCVLCIVILLMPCDVVSLLVACNGVMARDGVSSLMARPLTHAVATQQTGSHWFYPVSSYLVLFL